MSDTSRDWLLDRISDGVLLLDPDWRATYINPPAEALLEVQRETVLGNEVAALPNTWKTAWRQALSSGGQVTLPPAKRVRSGGDEYILEGEAHPAPSRGVGFVFRDGAARRRAEEDLLLRNAELEAAKGHLQAKVSELAEATRARDRFLAVMSHEMRTPLNAILGYTELLDMGLGGDLSEVQQTHVDRIRVAGTHLLDLINDVLDLARADARKLEVDIRPVDAVAVVEEVVALLEAQAEAKGLRIRLETPTERLPHVRADLQRLRQILTNLLGNAIKFTERGSVVIRCAPAQGDMVRISIADTGIGIAEDTLPMIFSEFYQAEISSLTRARGGSGLGLAIAQRLARLMGGDVTAQSRLGEGSTFSLVLPAATSGEIVPSETLPPHRDPRIPNARDVSKPVSVVAFGEREEVLAELGRQVYPAVRLIGVTDGAAVADTAREEGASLVVLDIGCGDGVVWNIAHDLRTDPKLAGTAVLLLPCIPPPSADELPGSLDLGWLSVVPKPFTAEQLTGAVSTAAAGSERPVSERDAEPGLDVLVVDDDPDSRRVAAKFLSLANVRVREAPDGETALAEMRHTRPAAVVLDLMMPVLDGFGVLATMRADPLLARIPVVVLTAKSLSADERRFLARTAARVLQKGEHRLADVAALVLRTATGAGAATPVS